LVGEVSILNATTYTYKSINFPGAICTIPYDINNNGFIIGEYYIEKGIGIPFIYNGVAYEIIEIEGAHDIIPNGLNNYGTVVGQYRDVGNNLHGFIYENGNISTYDIPDSARTILTGINDIGIMVGQYDPHTLNMNGFTDNDGIVTTNPGMWHRDINNDMDIVGGYSSQNSSRGYLLQNKTLTTVPPVNVTSYAWGINNLGQIVGNFYPDERKGFLFDGINTIEFDHPDANNGTLLFGINDLGIVVGYYNYEDINLDISSYGGFIATPVPLPSALLLFGSGLLGLAGWRRFRKG
jgi:uncharacterized membrane protein